jgi:hypothetical protein
MKMGLAQSIVIAMKLSVGDQNKNKTSILRQTLTK